MKYFLSLISVPIVGLMFMILFRCTSEPTAQDDMTGISQLDLPDDLEATLWATSPDFYNPSNIDIDQKGRVWVTEAVDYRLWRNEPALVHPEGDRVVILEDKDGDGKAESSKVFVQDKDLVAPLGIAVIGKKVFVSCSPHILVYTDEDGDDVPDKKEKFLTGFGGYDHDHSVHALLAGPDGRYYFNAGNAGPHIVTDKAGWTLRSGSLYNGGSAEDVDNQPGLVSDDGRAWTGGLALRINTDGTGLTVLGHNFRNSYEITVDSYGNMWQNDNDDDGNKGTRVTWLMEGANQGYFSADGSRTWKADWRPGIGRAAAHWHQEDPGVMPMGDSTGNGSPTGIVLNESDALGEKYLGMLLSCEAGRNVILAYHPKARGGGYKMDRTNLITSIPENEIENAESRYNGDDKNKWFRPSDIAVGTDGAWYIADWYDPVVGGHRIRDSLGMGRIYRITPKGKELIRPELDLTTTDGQIEALLSPAINVRHLGFASLAAKGATVIPEVSEVLNSDNPYHRARAIWLLAQLGPEGIARVEKLLQDNNPEIRIAAYRALRKNTDDDLRYAEKMSRDTDPAVRREVAVSLRDIPWDEMKDIGETLVGQYESGDRASLEALGLAFDGKENEAFQRLNQEMGGDPLEWSDAYADLVWRLHPVDAVKDLKDRAGSTGLDVHQRKQALVALGFINDQNAVDAMGDLTKSNLADVSEQASWWLSYRHNNDWNQYEMELPEGAQEKNLKKQQELVALKGKLLSEDLTMEDRVKIGRSMARSASGGEMLIGLASEGKLSDELKEALAEAVLDNPDQSVRAVAADYFKSGTSAVKPDVEDIMALEGVLNKGEAVFKSYCASCHRIGNEGKDIGPGLTTVGQKYGKSGLVDAIIHPSAGMSFGYESWLITMKDGTTLFGFLQGDGERVTIKDMTGKVSTIPASDIESRKQFSTSIMPEPKAMGLTDQDIADVSAYLLAL